MSTFFKELKRRNVFKETIAYLVVAWLILQILAVVLPIWKAPDWILQIVTITLALGLPLWVLFSWNYQITTSGIKKTVDIQVDQSQGSKLNSRLNLVIMIAIAAAIAIIWINPSMVSSKPNGNPSLVILPFENSDNTPENEWLGYSIAKNIRDQLAKIEALNVLDFKASKGLLNSEYSYEDIADNLDVAYILKGRVGNENGKLIIETELIDSSENLVWSDDFNNQSVNNLEVPNTISKDILNNLSIKISPKELTSLETKPTSNDEAYELFQRALINVEIRSPSNVKGAVQMLLKAIELDPNYAEAYGEIAYLKWIQATYRFVEEESVLGEINAYANKAINLNPNSSRALQVLGLLNFYSGNTEKGLENFDMALDINPNDAELHKILTLTTKFDDTLRKLHHSKKALLLNPHHRTYITNLFFNYLRYNMPLEAQELWNEKAYLYPDSNIRMMGYLKSILNKDWREYVKVVESFHDENNDVISNRYMAEINWRIKRDYSEQLKFIRIAYEKADPPFYRWDIFHALINNREFEEAENLLQEWDSQSDEKIVLSENMKNYYLGKLKYAQQEFEKALSYFSKIKETTAPNNTVSQHFGEVKLYKGIMMAKLGLMEDSNRIISLLNNDTRGNMQKALIFAAMKEEDSMYHYLNQSKNKLLYWQLSHKEFNPYRQQPRFIKVLEYFYLPIN